MRKLLFPRQLWPEGHGAQRAASGITEHCTQPGLLLVLPSLGPPARFRLRGGPWPCVRARASPAEGQAGRVLRVPRVGPVSGSQAVRTRVPAGARCRPCSPPPPCPAWAGTGGRGTVGGVPAGSGKGSGAAPGAGVTGWILRSTSCAPSRAPPLLLPPPLLPSSPRPPSIPRPRLPCLSCTCACALRSSRPEAPRLWHGT